MLLDGYEEICYRSNRTESSYLELTVTLGTMNPPAKNLESWDSGSLPRLQNSALDRRSRSRTQRRPSGSTAASSASPNNADRSKIGKDGK